MRLIYTHSTSENLFRLQKHLIFGPTFKGGGRAKQRKESHHEGNRDGVLHEKKQTIY